MILNDLVCNILTVCFTTMVVTTTVGTVALVYYLIRGMFTNDYP